MLAALRDNYYNTGFAGLVCDLAHPYENWYKIITHNTKGEKTMKVKLQFTNIENTIPNDY